MISRSTLLALTFACLATLSLAVAAAVQQRSLSSSETQALPMAIYQMPRVVVVGTINKQMPADPPAAN